MLELFIPKIKALDNITTASVPYKCKMGDDLFFGDVIEVEIKNDENDRTLSFKENFVVTLSEGRIIGATHKTNIYIDLHELPALSITNLGSSFDNPELLEILTK